MVGVRRGARAVLRYFVPLIAAAIVVQIFLAGEGIFGLKNVDDSDHCNDHGVQCIANSKSLDPHRGLGFILTEPVAFLLLVCALLAWHPAKRIRIITIVLPFVLFLQAVLAFSGRWAGAFHPLLAFVLLGTFGWLARTLWLERTVPAVADA